MASKLFGTLSIVSLLFGCADLSGGEIEGLPTEPVGIDNVRPTNGPQPAYSEFQGVREPEAATPQSGEYVVLIPDGGSLKVSLDQVKQTLQHDYTLEMWVWFEENTEQELLNADGLRLAVENGALWGEMFGVRLTGALVQRHEWTHVALQVTRNQVQLFINGVPQDREFLPVERAQLAGELVVGRVNAEQRSFRGLLDNLRLVSRALYQDGNFLPSTWLQPTDYTVFGFNFDQELPGELIPCATGMGVPATLSGGAGLTPGHI